MDIDIIVNGILLGSTIGSLSYGAVFFMLIKIAIQKGIRKALFFELGHILSILLVLVIVNFGILKATQIVVFEKFFSLIGGVFLIAFGITMYYTNTKENEKNENLKELTKLQYIAQGFIVNIFNPTDLIIWIGIFGTTHLKYNYSSLQNLVFGLIVLFSIASVDILKIYIAKKLGRQFFVKNKNVLSKIIETILILIGFSLLYNFLTID